MYGRFYTAILMLGIQALMKPCSGGAFPLDGNVQPSILIITKNAFCGTWYLPHSHVHNKRTVPIIMAGCMAHARNGYISTSGLKSDVIIVFLDPDFL